MKQNASWAALEACWPHVTSFKTELVLSGCALACFLANLTLLLGSHRLGGWAKQGASPCPSAQFCRIVWLGPGHHSLKLSLPHPSPFISLECHPPSTNKPPYSYLLLSAHWPRHPTDKHRLCTFPVLQSGLILIEIAAICGLSKCIHYSELPYTRDLRYLPK